MDKRKLVLDAFDSKPVERVPIGFWFHYLKDETVPPSEENMRTSIQGHLKYYEEFQPDFLKIMSDSYFIYPNDTVNVTTAQDLPKIKAGGDVINAWIDEQVSIVKELTGRFGKEVATFYTVFTPVTYLAVRMKDHITFGCISRLFKEDPQALKTALLEISKDIAVLAQRVITEGGADGIYFSSGSIQGVSREEYLEYLAPCEIAVLEAANEVSTYNMLHICGYEGRRNDLPTFANYPAKAINWAATVEGVGLAEGREIFRGKTLVGGFNNTVNGLLYNGSREEIMTETHRLLTESGTTGVILGADCTVPRGTPIDHLKWVREAAEQFGK